MGCERNFDMEFLSRSWIFLFCKRDNAEKDNPQNVEYILGIVYERKILLTNRSLKYRDILFIQDFPQYIFQFGDTFSCDGRDEDIRNLRQVAFHFCHKFFIGIVAFGNGEHSSFI